MDDKLEINTKGFNLINGYSLLCHYNKNRLNQNKNYLKEYSNKNKLLFLPEEVVLLVTNKKINII